MIADHKQVGFRLAAAARGGRWHIVYLIVHLYNLQFVLYTQYYTPACNNVECQFFCSGGGLSDALL